MHPLRITTGLHLDFDFVRIDSAQLQKDDFGHSYI
jgi:hypothetical protein